MSTDYTLTKTPRAGLFLLEHSGVVDLCVEQGDSGSLNLHRDMDSKELVRIALAMIKVASYLDGDLTECIKGQDEYTLSELRRLT